MPWLTVNNHTGPGGWVLPEPSRTSLSTLSTRDAASCSAQSRVSWCREATTPFWATGTTSASEIESPCRPCAEALRVRWRDDRPGAHVALLGHCEGCPEGSMSMERVVRAFRGYSRSAHQEAGIDNFHAWRRAPCKGPLPVVGGGEGEPARASWSPRRRRSEAAKQTALRPRTRQQARNRLCPSYRGSRSSCAVDRRPEQSRKEMVAPRHRIERERPQAWQQCVFVKTFQGFPWEASTRTRRRSDPGDPAGGVPRAPKVCRPARRGGARVDRRLPIPHPASAWRAHLNCLPFRHFP